MTLRPSLDDLRRLKPELSLALFAMEAGGPVTLEIYHGGEVYTFKAPTEAEAILAAFPPKPEEIEPQPDNIFD